jgi:hypothetical protein
MWLELLILSVIIAVIQAFAVGLVTVGARTLNPTLTLGASLLGAIIMVVLLLKAAGAIWEATSRMFRAMSQSVGGGLLSPAEAGLSAAGSVAGLAMTVATAGAGAAVALGAGASLSQVAGSALSGMDSLYSSAALGSFILPDDSALKGAAQGFYEGALSNRMLGPLGGLFLGEGGFGSAPGEPRTPPVAGAAPLPPGGQQPAVPTQAETDVRFDSADLSGLRDAVSTAMNQALLRAPVSGYRSDEAALQAVRDALRSIPLPGSPTGFAAGDRRIGDYIDQRAAPIASHILLTSQGRTPLATGMEESSGPPGVDDANPSDGRPMRPQETKP